MCCPFLVFTDPKEMELLCCPFVDAPQGARVFFLHYGQLAGLASSATLKSNLCKLLVSYSHPRQLVEWEDLQAHNMPRQT